MSATPPRSELAHDLALRRAERSDAADTRLRGLLGAATTGPASADGFALVAVGGYGRRELSPFSDLDVVLVHPDGVDPRPVAEQIWYPLWDDGVALDHAVRSIDQMREASGSDLRTALGLLDARHVAGNPAVTLQVRSVLLADWRAGARGRLPELAAAGRRRAERSGDLAYAAVPDLKESCGGLRDAVVLRNLVATWLVDVPHAEVERCRAALLAVRDALHETAGRAGDRLLPELLTPVAARVGVADLDRHVRELGRRISYLSDLTWRRVDAALSPAPRSVRGGRRPELVALAHGVARSGGEVVLDGRSDPARDALLGLRAAAAAAEHDLSLSPVSAVRLTTGGAALPEPWPAEARRLLVRTLGTGPALRGTWDALEQAGVLARLLPEWAAVSLRRSSSLVHRFTVDRHLVETCVEATRLLHRVRRPDLLLVAALLHDIGKTGHPGEHCQRGATAAHAIAARWGFGDTDCATISGLVRLHLLLPETATRRDLDDPATVHGVAEAVGTVEMLDLLAALTEADARATGPAAWTSWRARLVARLVARTRETLQSVADDAPAAEAMDWPSVLPGTTVVETEPHPDGTVVQVGVPDRMGLLSDVAAALATAGLEVLSARAGAKEGVGWSRWLVANPDVDARRVRQRLQAVLDGSPDPARRLRPPLNERGDLSVSVHHGLSATATVIEVRDRDWLGLVSLVCAALSVAGVDVRSAHLQTIGPQAVDVFYVCDGDGLALSPDRAASVADRVCAALRR